MISSDHVLELVDVTHTGQVEAGSFIQKLIGTQPTGTILHEISLETHAGEIMAILGSTGSGKRTLLEVIASKAQGSTRGQILLNDVLLTREVFRAQCTYIPKRADLLPGLTVRQTLEYASQLTVSSKVSKSVRRSRAAKLKRPILVEIVLALGILGTTSLLLLVNFPEILVKEVMADLALNQVANRELGTLTSSEYKRAVIGVDLVRDPVLILLDDPIHGLDPLNAYFIVSILSNHVRKYHRLVVLTLERPRSDIFPFLDRVTYLCFGEVLYTGNTRLMMDYFAGVGFPCPELENPLMYYYGLTLPVNMILAWKHFYRSQFVWKPGSYLNARLCLSTVDRQTRERFISSSCQIAGLVDKFKTEGAQFRKYGQPISEATALGATKYKLPLTAYGCPSSFQVFFALLRRCYATSLSCNSRSLREAFSRLLMLPLFFSFLFLFYFPIDSFQHSFVTRNGLVFNCLTAVTFLSAAVTAVGYAPHRNRYYQESRNELYRGGLFIVSQIVYSLLLSGVAVWSAGSIIYFLARMRQDLVRWAKFCAVLWAVYSFAENVTMAVMLFVKSSYTSFVSSIYVLLLYITLASGTVRSIIALPDALYYLSYGIIYRYAGAFLNYNEFGDHPLLEHAPYNNGSERIPCPTNNNVPGKCVYLNGTHYLSQRYHVNSPFYGNDLNFDLNFGLCFVFVVGMWLTNVLLYMLPLPLTVKQKFRE